MTKPNAPFFRSLLFFTLDILQHYQHYQHYQQRGVSLEYLSIECKCLIIKRSVQRRGRCHSERETIRVALDRGERLGTSARPGSDVLRPGECCGCAGGEESVEELEG